MPGPGVTIPSHAELGISQVRVLVADDYPDAAESLAELLGDEGFEVQIARDGVDALERTRAWHPHVCVLDLTMPKMDGLDIARSIRERQPMESPLLIALTGWGRDDDLQRAREAGFDHHFVKPADPTQIVEVIRSRTTSVRCSVV